MEQQPIYAKRNGISKQFTTFDPETGNKIAGLAPGERKTLAACSHAGMITRIWFTFSGWFWEHWNPECTVDTTILRKLILRIYWDGSDFPSVEVPMGDFFGVGHCEYRHFSSQYLGMSSGGFYCYFPMPFSKGFRIELENCHDTQHTGVFMNVNVQELASLPEDAGRFHCQFGIGDNTGKETLPILKAAGSGHFVGCALSIQGEPLNYLAYLEAPEYIYIDKPADGKPTIAGTGMEDYFNGGWYFRDGEFYAPLHGVPLKDTLRSMVSMYRFHDQDAIHFEHSIDVSFVNPWAADRLKPFKYSCSAYWYQTEAAPLSAALPPSGQLVNQYRTRDVDHQSIP